MLFLATARSRIFSAASMLIRGPSAQAGRSIHRRSAGFHGTLANYVVRYVNARLAEREKRLSADRALDLYTNSSIAHGMIESLIAETVGTGLTLQPSPMLDWLELDREWGTAWGKKAYDWFDISGLDPRKYCDAQRRLSIYGLQALAYFNWRLEGIAAFQVVKRQMPGGLGQICLLPICPSRIRTPSDKLDGGVFDGVEVDEFGAPRAIYVSPEVQFGQTQSLFDSKAMQRLEVWDKNTGLPKVLLVTGVRNVSEYRQDGILSSVIKDISDAEDFREAALIKAMLANLFSIFIEQSTPQGAAFGLNTSKGGGGQNIGDWSNQMQELERGMILTGGPGQKPTVIPNDAPGPNHGAMLDDIYTGLGMATGRGKENVTRCYEASYSASQMSNENAGRFSDCDRQVLADNMCQPWWMWKALEGVGLGFLPVKNQKHFAENLYAYTRASWMRPPSIYLDKQKIANADDTRLGNGTATYSDVYSEKGKDWRAALTQRAEEAAYIQELGKKYDLKDDWIKSNGSTTETENEDDPIVKDKGDGQKD